MRGSIVKIEGVQELIEKAQRGERAAFDAVAGKLESRLRSTIRARIGPHLRGALDEDDVYQDTLTRAFQSLSRFEWQGEGSFLRWLRGIAENLIRSAADQRKRRAVLEVERNSSPPSDVLVGTALRREERMERLEDALKELPEDYREVIILASIDG